MQEYNICYSLDSNYSEQLAVSITSILKNADIDDNINVYILDGGLSIEDKNKIELLKNIKEFNIKYISVLGDDFSKCPLLVEKDEKYKDYHVTLPTYFRFKLPEFLPVLEKVLFLDCDVIVKTSLKELFAVSLDDSAVAMVLDADMERETKRLGLEKYFNAGVMLINLDYWRKNNVENRLFEYAQNNQENILWQDQDIVNVVLKNEIKELDKSWNYQYFQFEHIDNNELGDVSILHLAGRFKPWLMPFESCVYDEYYSYLSFTAWKNNVLKYKQNSAGKYLKNQIGGSVTNILVNATDEDIQVVYQDVAKSYSEIKNLYDEIAKSNEFVKALDKDVRYVLGKSIDEKVTEVYEEIEKSYEYIKELDKEARYLLEKSTDEKIDLVYEEITRNYKYTESLVEKVKTEVSERLKEANLSHKGNLFDDLKSEIYSLNLDVENKIQATNDKIDEKFSQVEQNISEIKAEIDKNNNYAEYLVEISEQKQEYKLETVVTAVKNEFSKKDNKLNSEIEKVHSFVEEKAKILEEVFNENTVKIKADINKELTHQFREAYSYSNEHFSRLYKGLKDTTLNLEVIMNNKVADLYKNDNDFRWEIDNIKANLTPCYEVVNEIASLKEELSKQGDTNNKKIDELRKEYENQLNQQRIKYEKKLMHLENVVNESRKNPLIKLIDRIKKR